MSRPSRRPCAVAGLVRSVAVAAVPVLALGAGAPASASASASASARIMRPVASEPMPSPSSTVVVDGDTVTITMDLGTARRLCAGVASARRRLERLDRRVHGGAEVVGSVAWVEARAADARKAGNTRRADRLARRADRRTLAGERVRNALARLGRADDAVCPVVRDAG